MIEAYEIGIKLALQDGVSEGIAAIRRDLGSLDLTIAQTTLRLGQLQRIGAQALSVSQEQPERVASGVLIRRPAPVVVPSSPNEPEPVPVPVEVQVVTPAQSPLPRPPAGPPAVLTATRMPVEESGPVSAPPVARPDAARTATARPPTIVDAVRATGGPKPPELPAVAPLASVVPLVPPPAVASIARLVAPTLQAGEPMSQRNDPARGLSLPRPAGGMPSTPAGTRVAPQQISSGPGRRDTSRQPTHRHDEVREARTRQPVATPDQPVARMTPAPARPAALFSPTSSMAPPASSSYAPPAASPRPREASMRGDVFLDGARVGRWMSEQMARDAGRPNTGPTGFDPRRSPAWPGAAVTW